MLDKWLAVLRNKLVILRDLFGKAFVKLFGVFTSFIKWLFPGHFREMVLNLLIVLLLVLFSIEMVKLFSNRGTIIIDTFDVYDDLKKLGYSERVISKNILDAVLSIGSESDVEIRGQGLGSFSKPMQGPNGSENTNYAAFLFDNETYHTLLVDDLKYSIPELQIPEIGISVQSMFRYFREFLGLYRIKIGGEVLNIGSKTVMNMRFNVNGHLFIETITNSGQISNLNGLFYKAAEKLYLYSAPAHLAYYRYRHLYSRTKNLQSVLNDPEFNEAVELSLGAFSKDNEYKINKLLGSIYFQNAGYLMSQGKDANRLEVENSIQLARQYYKKALRIKPDYAAVYQNLASLELSLMQNPVKALEYLNRALRIDGNNDQTYGLLYECYSVMGRARDAIGILEKAERKLSGQVIYKILLGRYYTIKGDYNRALAIYKKALKFNNTDRIQADINNNIGYVYYLRKDLPRTLEYLRKAVDINPDGPNSYRNLAKVLAEAGNKVEAVFYYKKALSLSPQFLEAYLELKQLYLTAGDVTNALALDKSFIKAAVSNNSN